MVSDMMTNTVNSPVCSTAAELQIKNTPMGKNKTIYKRNGSLFGMTRGVVTINTDTVILY